ncbi:MAG: PAS domain S-box protein [Candidatus Heimdallarchaeota archaeon]|nr:PAS domain S-box protein [Candidatus Heimdallarchaeota archaeon]
MYGDLLSGLKKTKKSNSQFVYPFDQNINSLKNLSLNELKKIVSDKEKIFYGLFELTNDAIFIIDLKGDYLLVNERAAKLLGTTVKDMMGKNARDFTSPNEYDDVEKKLVKLKKGQILPIYERMLVSKDGKLIPVELNVALVKDKDGKPLYIQSTARDIRERKNFERKIRSSEERFRLAFENSFEAIFWIDVSTNRIENCNYAAEKLLSLKKREIIGKNYQKLCRSIGETENKISKEFASDIDITQERILITPDGKYHSVSITTTQITIDEKILRQCIVRDISKIKEAEEKYRILFNGAREGIVLIDKETGLIVDANPEFIRQSGRTIEHLQRMRIWELRPDEKKELAKTNFYEVIENGTGQSSELDLMRPDGVIIPIEFLSRVVTIHGKNYLLSISRDITDWINSDRKLKQQQEMLEKQRDELDSFASNVAHDIRGKLQIISLYNELIGDQIYAEKISEQINEMVRFLDNLLLLAKTGEIIGEYNTINLNDLLKDLIEKVKSLQKDLIIEKEKLPTIMGDKEKLHQVFENLFMNIIKHSQAKKLRIYSEAKDQDILIYIEDNGKGMDKNTQEKIIRAWETKRYTTFGLMIVKKIIEAHKGIITFKSKEKQGTTFIIQLPKKQ